MFWVFYKKAVGPKRDLQQNKKEVIVFNDKKYAKIVKHRNRMRNSKMQKNQLIRCGQNNT